MTSLALLIFYYAIGWRRNYVGSSSSRGGVHTLRLPDGVAVLYNFDRSLEEAARSSAPEHHDVSTDHTADHQGGLFRGRLLVITSFDQFQSPPLERRRDHHLPIQVFDYLRSLRPDRRGRRTVNIVITSAVVLMTERWSGSSPVLGGRQ